MIGTIAPPDEYQKPACPPEPSDLEFMYKKLTQLGPRMLAGLAAALFAAALIFATPEVGVAGAVGGAVCAGVSAVLMLPHSGSTSRMR